MVEKYKLRKVTLLLTILILSFRSFVHAQSNKKEEKDSSNFKFVPVPYISYDRSLGGTFGAVPMAMFPLSKKDTISPSSLVGAVGIYSTNDSWFVLGFSKLYFAEDKYRAVIAGGRGNINFQFFLDNPISPDYIDFNTVANFLMLQFQRRVFHNFYAGITYTYISRTTDFDVGKTISIDEKLNGVGLVATYDRRDDVYYPLSGFHSEITFSTFPSLLGNESESNRLEAQYNHFFKMPRPKDVLAARLYAGIGIGDLSFNQQFIVSSPDLRGYTQGKYRGDQLIALQSEYRFNPWNKIGFIAFGGVATVFSGINEGDNGKLLPAVGTGFRYNVFPKNHMNVGLDVAVGDGDWGIYFNIGEAF